MHVYGYISSLTYSYASDFVERHDYTSLAVALRQRARYVVAKGLTVVLVFDGGKFPAKSPTDMARLDRHMAAPARVLYDDAYPDDLGKAAAHKLAWPKLNMCIAALRRSRIPYVVAPYEADSQLAYMALKGTMDSALIVDSDFIVHGTPRTFSKVSYHIGWCFVVDYKKLLFHRSWPMML
jgi:exonuclease-1